MSLTSSAALRIQSMIDGARQAASASGQHFDLNGVYVRALVRCGISRDDAQQMVADPANDPLGRILHYAGESHNFAVLAVQEALAAA